MTIDPVTGAVLINWNAIFMAIVPQLLFLLVLTIGQVLLGIAVALKNKLFEWQKVGEFFGTIIIPRVIGWFVVVMLILLIPKTYLPESISNIGQSGAFLFVVGSFLGSIVANLRALGFLAENATLDKVGLPAKESPVLISGTLVDTDNSKGKFYSPTEKPQ